MKLRAPKKTQSCDQGGSVLILTLVVSGRQQDALATYDTYRGRFEMPGLVREELERSRRTR